MDVGAAAETGLGDDDRTRELVGDALTETVGTLDGLVTTAKDRAEGQREVTYGMVGDPEHVDPVSVGDGYYRIAGVLDTAVTAYRDIDTGGREDTDDGSDTYLRRITGAVSDVVTSAAGDFGGFTVAFPAPAPVHDEITQGTGCGDILGTPVVDEDTVHGPTVELWRVAEAARAAVATATEVFADEESLATLATYDDLADAHGELADALDAASEKFATWVRQNPDTGVVTVDTAGADGRDNYMRLADRVREVAESVRAAGATGDTATVTEGADTVREVLLDEGRTRMRVHREARPVNQVTAGAVEKL